MLGIRPWEMQRLTVDQFERCVDWVEQCVKDQGGGRG